METGLSEGVYVVGFEGFEKKLHVTGENIDTLPGFPDAPFGIPFSTTPLR